MTAPVHVLRTMRDVVEERLRDRLGRQRSRGLLVTEVEGGLVNVGCPNRLVRWLVERHLGQWAYEVDGLLITIRGWRATADDLRELVTPPGERQVPRFEGGPYGAA